MLTFRVGLLVPSSNTVMERDLHRELSPWAEVHTSRMALTDVTPQAEQEMLDREAIPAARRVADTRPDVVVFGCTSASSLHGADYDEEFRSRVADVVDAPVVGVLSSVLEELVHVGRVALLTPYVEALTRRIRASLVAAGVLVSTSRCLGIRQNLDIGDLTPDDVVASAVTMDLSAADVLFCSCTNLRAYEAVEQLRSHTGMPVVTSNQAVVSRLRVSYPQLGLAYTPR